MNSIKQLREKRFRMLLDTQPEEDIDWEEVLNISEAEEEACTVLAIDDYDLCLSETYGYTCGGLCGR